MLNFQNATPLTIFIQSEPDFIINKIVMQEYKVLNVPKIQKVLWHFEIFVNTGPYGAGNFTYYYQYIFHPI